MLHLRKTAQKLLLAVGAAGLMLGSGCADQEKVSTPAAAMPATGTGAGAGTVYGTPGSPSATMSLDGKQLPAMALDELAMTLVAESAVPVVGGADKKPA